MRVRIIGALHVDPACGTPTEERVSRSDSGRADAVITVFFTLVSVLYLGVIFMLVESARIQGARAQTANITDMSSVSAFGEYEVKLLEDYEIFAIDGTYGTGDFHIDRVGEKLWTYARRNADVSSFGLAGGAVFDPWQVSVTDCEVTGYTLLTDSSGEAFYQEAVAYMRGTAMMQMAGDLIEYYQNAQDADDKRKDFEEKKANSDTAMDDLEKQEEAARKEVDELIEDEDGASSAGPQMTNPLPALKRLARKDILSIVCGSAQISSGSVGMFSLCSTRWGKKRGNLSVTRTYSGLLNDLLFREYLLDRFPCWSEAAERGDLRYGLEYIICGHRSDRENLRGTVRRLLLLREGCNYAYAINDATMNAQAGTAASLIIGWTGIAPLTAVLKHALLLGWSYGESLLDVRTLMDGGKVPLYKQAGEWELGLSDLASIETLLGSGRRNRSRGLNYSGYLRILLNLQLISTQKIRGLDLIEMYIKTAPGLSNFQADHCIAAIRDRLSFSIADVFGTAGSLWLGSGSTASDVTVKGGYSYLPLKGAS